jgi:hypothetical protein
LPCHGFCTDECEADYDSWMDMVSGASRRLGLKAAKISPNRLSRMKPVTPKAIRPVQINIDQLTIIIDNADFL